MDNDKPDGVMICFLPTSSDWCQMELPHMTLVYAGKVDKLSPTDVNTLAKEASTIALLQRPFVLRVSGIDTFGPPGERVKVLRFRSTPELWALRQMVEKWNRSEYTEFKPHATIGPENVNLDYPPTMIAFDRVMFAWGEESLTFNLK